MFINMTGCVSIYLLVINLIVCLNHKAHVAMVVFILFALIVFNGSIVHTKNRLCY